MVKPRAKSKRQPLSQRYNINKKAKEHERKQKRAAKKNPALRKKLNKDPGIPNLNPYKVDLLRKMEAQKKLLSFQDQQRARQAQELARAKRDGGDALSNMLADAVARDTAFTDSAAEDSEDRMVDTNAGAGEQTRKAFYKHVKQVLEKADIILEVLDARDPLGCRAHAVEQLALACDPPKRVVLVLNKIDLVPPQVVQQWLAYLRKDFPTVAFKASTQQQRGHLSAPGGAAVNKATESGEVVTGSGAAGADTLLQLIKNYSRSHDLKQAVTVGIVGYPNVGKSSLINSLKRGRAVGVSSTPGFTRVLQEVSLDSKVTLIDCPGIIFEDGQAQDEEADGGASLLLKNCVSVDQIEDPEAAVEGILSRCAPAKMMELYGLPVYSSTADFLTQIAVKRGKLTRGGIPDKVTAARTILQDWNSGKIPFFVLPPEEEDGGAGSSAFAQGGKGKAKVSKGEDVGAAAIVSQWSKEFGMDAIMAAEQAELSSAAGAGTGSGSATGTDWVGLPTAGKGKGTKRKADPAAAAKFLAIAEGQDEEEEDDDEDMEDDEDDDDEDEDDEEEEEDEDEMDEEEATAALGKGKQGAGAAGPRFALNAGAAKAAGKEAYDFSAHFGKMR